MGREMQRKRESVLVTTSLRVERELLDDFQRHAQRNYRTGSAELRRLMAEYVKNAAEQEAAAA
jgi:hypothetical protein